jgi:hypothetical protein
MEIFSFFITSGWRAPLFFQSYYNGLWQPVPSLFENLGLAQFRERALPFGREP